MSFILEKEAKSFFSKGVYSSCSCIHTSDSEALAYGSSGWVLYFNHSKDKDSDVLKTYRGAVRVFKSLDGVSEAVTRIGFKSFSVQGG